MSNFKSRSFIMLNEVVVGFMSVDEALARDNSNH